MRGKWRTIAASVIAVAATACGTTVQTSGLASQSSPGSADQGLGIQSQPGAGQPSVGSAVPGGTGAAGAVGSGAAPAPTSPGSLPSAHSPGLGGGVSSGPGSTSASRGPIELGILYTVNDGAQSAGVNNGNNFTLEAAVHALVASYNRTGGIGGRRIKPVYAQIHSASDDYETQIQAACAAFTQDHHVAAVLSNLGYYSDNLLACLGHASVPMVSGDWGGPDKTDARQFPLFITPDALLGESRMSAMVAHLTSTGFLSSSNRIGVVIEDCPIDHRVYENGLLPALHRAGLTVAGTTQPKCFQAIQDLSGEASNMQSAVLQFRQHQVDRVMFVSQGSEANLAFLFMRGADAQHWTPGYALTSTAAPTILAANAPAGQLANAKGLGWLPVLDSVLPSQTAPTAAGRACLNRMKREGIQPASSADYAYSYGPCDTFALYDDLLHATAGDASASAVLHAASMIGGQFAASYTLSGQEMLADGRIAAGVGRLFAYVAGRGFEYTGGSFAL